MTKAKLLEAISKDDTTEVMCAKIDAIFEGDDLVKAALGETWYLEQTTGETMAGNDGKRNKTASRYASQIMDALRFARADSAKFLGFVEGLREIHASIPTCPDVLGDSHVDGTLPCYVQCEKCLECHGW